MKRYPHKANVKISGGAVIDGEWVSGESASLEVIGRYDPSNNENLRVKNSHGDEVVAKAEFYTRSKPISGAERLIIAELGIDEVIISWWGYQTHSVIYI